MARTTIAAQTLLGAYPSLAIAANAADLTFAALSGSSGDNGNQTPLTGKEILLFRNDDVGAQTVTITSVADRYNRTGDISAYSIGASEYAILGPFAVDGWKQSDGNLYFEGSDANVKCAVLRLP